MSTSEDQLTLMLKAVRQPVTNKHQQMATQMVQHSEVLIKLIEELAAECMLLRELEKEVRNDEASTFYATLKQLDELRAALAGAAGETVKPQTGEG